jgi:riboflavin biosynthesis pyrimidine reductase
LEATRGKTLPLPPKLARLYGRLRMPLKRSRPHVISNFVTTLDGIVSLNVKGHASGRLDLRIPVFASIGALAMIVTTQAGEKRLRKQKVPESVEIRSTRGRASELHSSFILEQVRSRLGESAGKVILVEGGPTLLGTFYAEQALDEQFLTLAPQVAGRAPGDQRLSLVMGRLFAPRRPLWGTLTDLRRGGSHLFLRYSFSRSTSH